MKDFKKAFLFLFSFLLLFSFIGFDLINAEDEIEIDSSLFECTIPCGLPTEMVRIPPGGRFGDPRTRIDSEGNQYIANHIGLDISNDCEKPVWIQADGVITKVSYDNSRGNYVVVNHGRYETWYAHLSEVLVTEGLPVEKREIIGRIGKTGYAEGCHLHYEIWRDGEVVDPEPFVNYDIDPENQSIDCETGRYFIEEMTCKNKEIRDIPEDRAENHFEKNYGKSITDERKNEELLKQEIEEETDILIAMINELKLEGKLDISDDNIDKLNDSSKSDNTQDDFIKNLESLVSDLDKSYGKTSFERNLSEGYSGEDVRELQRLLNKKGYIVASSGPGSPGNETSYFGPLTKKAVIKFQEAFASRILHPSGLTLGTGFVGPLTRGVLNSL